MTSAARLVTTINPKTSRQLASEIITPEMAGPKEDETATVAAMSPIAEPRRASEKTVRSMAKPRLIAPAVPTACIIRATTMAGKLGASMQASEAQQNAASDIRRTRR